MKILVSSKGFSGWLRSIKIADDPNVNNILLAKNQFTVVRGGDKLNTILVETKDNDCDIEQHKVRWDWLYRDLSGIQEQPVVIEFLDNVARFTLTYSIIYFSDLSGLQSPTPPETVEEAAEKFKAEHPLAKTLLTDYFTAGAQWQLRQQLNFPENKQEQLNWFLINALRLFDDNQLKVLTKEIGDRCGAFRQEWINVKDTPARRDIEIWAYDDDWHVCTIHPEFAEESDYEAVLFWQPFYRPSPPISK